MRLIDCYIENFGRLSDFKYSFSDGLNSIKKDNGYGKTTLTVFIKAMLYGLDDTKRAKIENNERKHYLPWNGGRCAGSLTFEAGEKEYRIERCFMPKASEDTFKLYDVKSGKESFDFSEKVGEELFSIDADGFERTVFLSEANLSGKNENKTVSAKLSDLVGVDGDLSVMDEAIELLEKQRKIYHKRGNTGEIWDVRDAIGDVEREINDLTRMKLLYRDGEEELRKITAELTALQENKGELLKKAKLIEEARVKRSYEKQYLSMKKSVLSEEAAKAELERFFERGLPTREEIEAKKELSLEARRLAGEESDFDSAEYLSLAEFFAREPLAEEFDKMTALCDKVESLSREKELLERSLPASEREARADIPSVAEIDALIKKILSKKVKNANKGLHLPLYLGILAAGVGMLLGVILSPIFLILSALGLAGVAYDLIYSRKNGSSDDGEGAMARACELIRSYGYTGELGDDVIERLYEIKARAEADKRAQGDRALTLEKIKALTSEIGEDERALREFIMLFPVAATSSIREAITEILKKRVLYSAIKEARMTSNKKREERLLLASKYDAEVSAFLSRFPTATQRPFDEINARLIEYNAQKLSIERMSASLAAFAEEHGINPENICESDEPTLTESLESEALDEKISELERQRALSERALRNYADELERIDELQEKKEALLEKEEEYERRLGIILKTEDYLSRAKDNLTSKYLSKTKCAFDKYISLISREVGEEFSMDTSFALMKNESGTLRVAEAYSKGTRDLYALATRFALIDSLYSDEAPFVILDDPFAYFDDAKFSRAVSVIKNLAKGRQIIYLTCSDARKI